jgi:hypothetical protein
MERTCLLPFDGIKVAAKRLSDGKVPLSKARVAKREFLCFGRVLCGAVEVYEDRF